MKRYIVCTLLMAPQAWAGPEIDWYSQLLYYHEEQDFEMDRPNNPGNRVLRLAEHADRLEWRPELLAEYGNWELDLQPRVTYVDVSVPNVDVDSDSDSDVFLRYWTLNYYRGDYWFKGGRYVNLWGPARVVSPSNRYHSDTGQTNPNLELEAREYVEFGGYIDDNWQFQLTVNTGEGRQEIAGFETTGELRLTWQNTEISASALVVKPEAGHGLGGFGQWTMNDALIVYGDFLWLNEGQSQRRLLNEASGDEREGTFSSVAGLSYTFTNGLNVTLDYYRQGAGLSGREIDRLLNASHQLTDELFNGTIDGRGVERLTAINRLPFYRMGNDYVFAMLQRNNIWDALDIGLIAIQNLSDDSAQYTLNLEYRWLDALSLYAGVNHFSGGQHSEFDRFVDRQFSIGFKCFM